MAVPLVKHSFTVEEFHCMVQAAIFSEDDRVELPEREVVQLAPANGCYNSWQDEPRSVN